MGLAGREMLLMLVGVMCLGSVVNGNTASSAGIQTPLSGAKPIASFVRFAIAGQDGAGGQRADVLFLSQPKTIQSSLPRPLKGWRALERPPSSM